MRSVGPGHLTPALAALGAIALLGWLSMEIATAQGGKKEPPAKAKTVTIEMQDDFFVPEIVTIKKGDSIVWVNKGNHKHTATEVVAASEKVKKRKGGPFNEVVAKGASSKTIRFDRAPGTITYYCTIHGTPTTLMKGKIVIEP